MENSNRVIIDIHEDTADMVAKLAIGAVLAFSQETPKNKRYTDMVIATIEYVEQVIDPSLKSVTMYQELLTLLPEGFRRQPPKRIQDFLDKMATGRF